MVQTRATTKRKLEDAEPSTSNQGFVKPSDFVKPAKRRNRRKPGELGQLNLDVFFLIIAYLHPMDLLNLARTSKFLRALLMSNTSESVWKAARLQVEGLPDCPADLTEPEYANLAFYARCHDCGKYVKTVHWLIRRRYCPKCREESLREISTCKDWIREKNVLPSECLTIGGITTIWVDNGQMKSIEAEYRTSSDKNQFLSERRDKVQAIKQHAQECILWEKGLASKHRLDIESRRRQRENSIFSRLRQLGFQPEIAYFGGYSIKYTNSSIFKTCKPLMDKEWDEIWPGWQQTMDDFRLRRLDHTVYRRRRELLTATYNEYVAHRASGDTSIFILPHVDDLARLPPFQHIIKADEGAQMGDKPFESEFDKLFESADESKRLEIPLAQLVEIPTHLSLQSSGKRQTLASRKIAPTHRLQLACAVFSSGYVGAYPDILHLMHSSPFHMGSDKQDTLSRCRVKFLKDAPYIVHACGLDPNIATAEDMDRRNARLRCLVCGDQRVHSWRNAMVHAHYAHAIHKQTPQWQAIGDEHMNAILAAESKAHNRHCSHTRCMLCHPRVGDMVFIEPLEHLLNFHSIAKTDAQEGVHYISVGIPQTPHVRVVGEGELTFELC